jgi:hypothetical protein
MSYTLTLEPDVVKTAEACASRRGKTLDSLIRAYLVSFVREEESEGDRLSRELDSFVANLPEPDRHAPRVFHRSDAYDEELA